MFVLQYLQQVLVRIIDLYELLIVVRCILSFFPINADGLIIRFVYSVTEFILAPIRAWMDKTPIGPSKIMLDFSPFIAIMILEFAIVFVRIL